MIAVAAIILNALWQDALLVLCVSLFLRAWPRINASTRYVVWCATLVAAFVVPIATTLAFFAPAQRRSDDRDDDFGPRVAPDSLASGVRAASNAASERVQRSATTSQQLPVTMPALPQRLRVTLPWGVALAVFGAWAILALYALAGLAVGLWRLEQLKRDALPLPIEYRDAMPQWNAAFKGRRPVRLCVSEAIDVPVAVGLFDAMILIPRPLLDHLSPAEVEQISLHELAHLRRADDWSNCLQRLIVAALGWNPGALFIAQQLELEREVACDDWVLSSGGTVRPYALCLTKMAESAAWPHHPMPAPGVFATRKQISLRIERLLGSGRNIATTLAIGPAAAAVGAVGALALVIAFVAPSVAAPAFVPASKAAPVIAASLAPSVAPSAAAHASRAALGTTPMTPPSPKVIVVKQIVKSPSVAHSVDVSAIVHNAIAQSMAAVPGAVATQVSQNNGKSCVGCDLHGVNWSGRDLRGANYTGVDFSGANLSGANLSGSTLNGTDFSKANLSGVSFRNAHLTGCDFSRANLTGTDFTGVRMSGCDFTAARLSSSQVRDVLDDCKACDFTRADLSGLDLRGVRINGDDFSQADLRGVNLSGAEIVGSDFSKAKLDGANFAGATLNGCDLDGVDLTHVDFSKTKLIGMDFSKRGSPP